MDIAIKHRRILKKFTDMLPPLRFNPEFYPEEDELDLVTNNCGKKGFSEIFGNLMRDQLHRIEDYISKSNDPEEVEELHGIQDAVKNFRKNAPTSAIYKSYQRKK